MNGEEDREEEREGENREEDITQKRIGKTQGTGERILKRAGNGQRER